jgi:hypothetical protein
MANWLANEVRSVGGDASIAKTSEISGLDDAKLIEQFHTLRNADYAEIEEALEPLVKAAAKRDDEARSALKAELRRAQQRLEDLARVDFFKAEGGARLRALCERARVLLEGGAPVLKDQGHVERADYQGRLWATRARPKIDRLASAWLIRHFIDPASRFAFFAEKDTPPRDAVTFDTYGGSFTHEGEDCTFEVLVRRFGIDDPGVRALAEVIHDADLNDDKFGRLEHLGLNTIIRGLVDTIADDQALVMAGFPIFAALRAALAVGPERPAPKTGRRPKAGRTPKKAR